MIHEYFPPIAPALQEEISNHPDLMRALQRLPDESSMEERFAMVLAYCGMVVDGWYDEKKMEKLFGIAMVKLRDKRMSVVN